MIKRKAVSVNAQECEVRVDGEALGAVVAKLEAGYRDVILLTLYRAHGMPTAAPSVFTSQDARNLATALHAAARMADKGAMFGEARPDAYRDNQAAIAAINTPAAVATNVSSVQREVCSAASLWARAISKASTALASASAVLRRSSSARKARATV